MQSFQNITESLRPLFGIKSWDYCVFWNLGDGQRFLEWAACCCGGSSLQQEGENQDLGYPVSPTIKCLDINFPHPNSRSCHLLAQLPPCISLDSGPYADALISNQPSWSNLYPFSNSTAAEEATGTRVLVPVQGGLIELFSAKQISEDQGVIDFIFAQCISSVNPGLSDLEPNMSDFSLDPSFFRNLDETRNHSFLPHTRTDPFDDPGAGLYRKQETGRSDSLSDVSEEDDDDDCKFRQGRIASGKRPPAKNLQAERNRRKRLNQRLYELRALVPNITKLDRASILGDAIDYVKELEKQIKELCAELAENSDEDDARQNGSCSKVELKRNHEAEANDQKAQQMEAQVEVARLSGNELFVRVFCEHRHGGFATLMEALDSLGLEVTSANVTTFRRLVSNVFRVKMMSRDDEGIEVDRVRDSLLELTRMDGGRRQSKSRIEYQQENLQQTYHYHSNPLC